jgi:hypothetical protein
MKLGLSPLQQKIGQLTLQRHDAEK